MGKAQRADGRSAPRDRKFALDIEVPSSRKAKRRSNPKLLWDSGLLRRASRSRLCERTDAHQLQLARITRFAKGPTYAPRPCGCRHNPPSGGRWSDQWNDGVAWKAVGSPSGSKARNADIHPRRLAITARHHIPSLGTRGEQ